MKRPVLKFNLTRGVKRQSIAGRLRVVAAEHRAASLAALCVALLALASFGGAVLWTRTKPVKSDRRVVIVSHDHVQQTVPTKEPTVGALLQKLNIKLGQGDIVEPAASTPIRQDDFRINVYRAVPVKIVDGSTVNYTFSAATTPRSIASQTGVSLYPEDRVNRQPTADFTASGAVGEQVVVDRATPVSLNLYGTPEVVRTHATTVGELIKEKGIKLASGDQLSPAPATPLAANSMVLISRNGTRLETVTEPIAMPVQSIADPSLAYGTSAVRQQGSPGEKTVTYQVNLVNNVVVSRTPIQEVVTKQPVTQIVVSGSSLSGIKGDMALAGIAPSDYNYVDYIVSHESGWCPTKAQGQHDCPAVPTNQYTSGGYGLCQATPGTKMASAGSDWGTNPVTQLKWCNGYAVGHYGSWAAAYRHWIAYSWW